MRETNNENESWNKSGFVRKKNRKNYEYNEGNTELDKMICCETRETA